MIECKELCVSIKGKEILKNISLSANAGEITSVIGRNGSGKSTLLYTLSGSIKYSGNVFINGKDIGPQKNKELAKQIALMPQILPSPDISVESLVSFGRAPYTSFSGILSEEDRHKVKEAIEEMGLSELAGRNTATLSGGERQRAFFAMILAQDTDIVMTDEPTTYLDAPTKKELFNFLNLLKAKGKTVVTVLHDINDTLSISDKIHLIDNGERIFSGTANEFVNSGLPEKIFSLERLLVSDGKDNKYFFK